jgi:hypothetical protein
MVLRVTVSERCATDRHYGCEEEDDECKCPCHQGRKEMAQKFQSMLVDWIGSGLFAGLLFTGIWLHGIRSGIERFFLVFGIVFFLEAYGRIRWIAKWYR